MKILLNKYDVNEKEIRNKLWMSERQLENLSKKGHVIGLHSYSHPYKISKLSYNEQLKEYKKNYSHTNDTKLVSPSYMAYKQDECNAKVEVTEKTGLHIKTMQSFNVNVCKNEINRTLSN